MKEQKYQPMRSIDLVDERALINNEQAHKPRDAKLMVVPAGANARVQVRHHPAEHRLRIHSRLSESLLLNAQVHLQASQIKAPALAGANIRSLVECNARYTAATTELSSE
jgi:hypothetical protein